MIQVQTGKQKYYCEIIGIKKSGWVPTQETELRIVVKRLLGNLPAGEEETYTTDTEGMVTAEFIRDSLPGDSKGFFTIIARTEESEIYGNIAEVKIITWGVPAKIDNTFFNQRTLWSTRNKTPPWLLFMAYSIALGVWGTIIYLVFQFFKIKKMGKAFERGMSS